MFCSKCGKEISEGSSFCASCGAPVDERHFQYEPDMSIQTPQKSVQKTQNTQNMNVKEEADESVKKSKKTLFIMIAIAAAIVIIELLTFVIFGRIGIRENSIFLVFFLSFLIGGFALVVVGGIMSVRAFSINNIALGTMNETYENGVDLGIMTNDELEQTVRSMELRAGRYIGRGTDGTVLIEGASIALSN